jgi:4-hydroxy-tetrahydrodipicolinate reductase
MFGLEGGWLTLECYEWCVRNPGAAANLIPWRGAPSLNTGGLSMEKRIRVIQYGVGPIGAGIVKLMLQKPSLQVVGAVDTDPAMVGRDLGLAIGLGSELGVKISKDLKGALTSPADVVVHSTNPMLPNVVPQVSECLQAGLHVISTCEELCFPFRKYPEITKKLDTLAREHNVVILGTGVNPGFAMDKLVLTLATACQQVHKVKVRRVVDASRRRLSVHKMIGAGLSLEEFGAQVASGVIKHHGLPESVGMIAHYLGLQVDRIEESLQPVVSETLLRTLYFDVPVGHVKGIRQVCLGMKGDEESIRLELEMCLGAPESVDSVHIFGIPDLEMKVVGGIHGDIATAAIAVNCIPSLYRIRPGLRIAHDVSMCYFPGVERVKVAVG